MAKRLLPLLCALVFGLHAASLAQSAGMALGGEELARASRYVDTIQMLIKQLQGRTPFAPTSTAADGSAQGKQQNQAAAMDSLQRLLDTLQLEKEAIRSERDRLRGRYTELESSSSGQIDSLHALCEKQNREQERIRSERKTLHENLEKVRKENRELQARADTLLMVSAEVRLSRRYNEKLIHMALDRIGKYLVDRSLEKRYSKLMTLLKNYRAYNEDLLRALRLIEGDEKMKRTMRKSESNVSAIQKLRSTKYYKEYHDGQEWNSWSIDYLNDRIDWAIARIEDTSTKLNLQDIIDSLDPIHQRR